MSNNNLFYNFRVSFRIPSVLGPFTFSALVREGLQLDKDNPRAL